MGAGGEDIQMSQAARQAIPFSLECKNCERLNLWDAIKQSQANTPAGIDYAVVFKKNNEQPQVAIAWKTFLKLINPQSDNTMCAAELRKIAAQLDELASSIR